MYDGGMVFWTVSIFVHARILGQYFYYFNICIHKSKTDLTWISFILLVFESSKGIKWSKMIVNKTYGQWKENVEKQVIMLAWI